ncbi:peptidoglycan-binding protein, partial [Clostridium saudiense]|nr:peptidoglycan-binding protein [Clostridium saudiense]
AYDHYFVNGRDIFENISRIVDDIFNDYISRTDFVEPLLAQYCNGTTVTCDGLSQWGTVSLANSGYTPFNILTYYYGNNIELRSAPVVEAVDGSYPGTPLKLGSSGDAVKTIQTQLNRIAKNYPAIPITKADGYFDETTEKAVKTFQKIFNLSQDGIVGKGTWYKISQIYVGVKNLAELDSEGEKLPIESTPPSYILKLGSKGDGVKVLQYFLNCIALFYDNIPPVKIDGIFGEATKNAVEAFQQKFGLNVDGIVGKNTWRKLYEIYKTVEPYIIPASSTQYPGYIIAEGSSGSDVRTIQTWLSAISKKYPSIPSVNIDGIFGPLTTASVIAFQEEFNLIPDGLVGKLTWDKLYSVYS